MSQTTTAKRQGRHIPISRFSALRHRQKSIAVEVEIPDIAQNHRNL